MKGKRQLFIYILAASLVTFVISGAFAAKARLVDIKVNENVNISTKTIKNTDQYINVDIKIPVIEGLKDSNMQNIINMSFEKDAADFKSEMEQHAREGFEEAKTYNYPFNLYQAFIEYKVTYNSDNIISIPITYYSYLGGAHGTTDIFTRNINIKTGKDINIKDMFREGINYTDIIKQEVIKQIKLQPELYFEEAVKTVEESTEEFLFYIEDGNIVVYYPLYSIAPYAAGIREFKIPFEIFKDKINPEYQQIIN